MHGFDSFVGLPETWGERPKGTFSTGGVLPTVPANVTLHAGWFDETLPKFLAEHPGYARMMNIDCDIYSSTVTILENFRDRITKGTIILFDEYIGNATWREDEFKAFSEFVNDNNIEYEYLAFNLITKQVVVEIK